MSTPTPIEDRVRLIRIQTFFSNGRGNPVALIAGAVVFAVFLHEAGAPGASVVLWSGGLCVLAAVLFLLDRYIRHVGVEQANVERFLLARFVLGGLGALLFGLSVLLIPEGNADVSAVFGFIVVTTLATVSYMTYATVFPYCVMTNVAAVWPYVVYFFNRYAHFGDRLALVVGLTSIIWHLIVIARAWHISRYAVGVIRTREQLRDEISGRLKIEQALRRSEENALQLATMLRLLCDNVPDMIWAKDLDNRFLFVNKAYADKLLGAADADEPVGKTYAEYFQRDRQRHPENPAWHSLGEFSEDIDRHTLSREEPTIFEEAGGVRGRELFLDVHQARFVNRSGEVIGTVGCARDITERKASEAYVKHLAHHDALTDLPNRLLLSDRLRNALAQARRDRTRLAIIFLDLDNLKPVNDTFGHDVGDLLLKEVARRLFSVVSRETDTVARLGGDEFVVLLARISRDQDAGCVAERILRTLAAPLLIAGCDVSISASLGIALYPQHGDDAATLLRNADHAMYAAKNAGRNTFRYFRPTNSGGEG